MVSDFLGLKFSLLFLELLGFLRLTLFLCDTFALGFLPVLLGLHEVPIVYGMRLRLNLLS